MACRLALASLPRLSTESRRERLAPLPVAAWVTPQGWARRTWQGPGWQRNGWNQGQRKRERAGAVVGPLTTALAEAFQTYVFGI